VVLRKVYPQVPPKVEYSLAPLGNELVPLMGAMKLWGERVLRHRAAKTSDTTEKAKV
jgi:DNA-binding HxlR family transcriptional regulator